MHYLSLALLAVDYLGWDDLGGGGLGSRAHTFGLGDNHLGNGPGGSDDCWFCPLNSLQGLLTLKFNNTQFTTENKNKVLDSDSTDLFLSMHRYCNRSQVLKTLVMIGLNSVILH